MNFFTFSSFLIVDDNIVNMTNNLCEWVLVGVDNKCVG